MALFEVSFGKAGIVESKVSDYLRILPKKYSVSGTLTEALKNLD